MCCGAKRPKKTRRSDVSERLLFHQLEIIWLLVYLNQGGETIGLTCGQSRRPFLTDFCLGLARLIWPPAVKR